MSKGADRTDYMDHCIVCGRPIDTSDWVVAIEKHMPPGSKGCRVTFRFVNREIIKALDDGEALQVMDAPALGSADCALRFLHRFFERHTEPLTEKSGTTH